MSWIINAILDAITGPARPQNGSGLTAALSFQKKVEMRLRKV